MGTVDVAAETGQLRRADPVEFRVQAVDEVTDLHGVRCLPRDFDPQQSYPVVGSGYGGPQTITAAAEDFGVLGVRDRVAALRVLAARHPWLDITRTGAIGISFGGYYAARCDLVAPELYRAIGAAAGPDDFRLATPSTLVWSRMPSVSSRNCCLSTACRTSTSSRRRRCASRTASRAPGNITIWSCCRIRATS
nr:prolyl oligopeptidase family serine peptidase [Amycolatopsis jejuensis]